LTFIELHLQQSAIVFILVTVIMFLTRQKDFVRIVRHLLNTWKENTYLIIDYESCNWSPKVKLCITSCSVYIFVTSLIQRRILDE